MTRRGFALIVVLYALSAASVVALSMSLMARDSASESVNRADLERARWRANDCEQRARAAIDDVLAGAARQLLTVNAWRSLDRRLSVQDLSALGECTVGIEAAGARLDINSASAEQLGALFRGMRLAAADELADRVIDWRDEDELPLARGAERDKYVSLTRVLPRNGPFASLAELRRVIGFDSIPDLESVLSVEGGRIAINAASPAVLATVPGFSDEVIARIMSERAASRSITDILSLAASTSATANDSIVAHFPLISRITTADPDAWILTARGYAGTPPIIVTTETRLILNADRAHSVRWRSYP